MDKVGIGMMIQEKIRQYNMEDEQYPKKLKELHNPPKKIYVLGKLPDPNKPSVAIVGARNASPYGRAVAREFAKTFARHGVQVISGFARGIDSAGHRGALEGGGDTFAVLGNGVDVCYPNENRELYKEMIRSGGMISEFAPGTQPRPKFFPMRNRYISGLADVILVVEAKEKSGSLITVDYGLEQGKDIFAVPGRITDELSRGCNRLICQGAGIALEAETILNELNVKTKQIQTFGEKVQLTLAPQQESVYSCIRLNPKHVDEIQKECKLEINKLLSILLELEIQNLIQEVSNHYYIRI